MDDNDQKTNEPPQVAKPSALPASFKNRQLPPGIKSFTLKSRDGTSITYRASSSHLRIEHQVHQNEWLRFIDTHSRKDQMARLLHFFSAQHTEINQGSSDVTKAASGDRFSLFLSSSAGESDALSSAVEEIVVTEDVVAEVFTEDELKEMEQASECIDKCNTRLSEKLAVLDHMEARRRLKMDELEAMVARL